MSFLSLFSLPNLLTLINLFFGCIALLCVFNYHLEWVAYCTLISLVADFLDGFAARLTNSSSNIGKQLDSLADVVSFGVVPGAVLFQLLFQKFESEPEVYSVAINYAYSVPAFLVTLFAALRLAKFNVDTRQATGFLGLPTPAMTTFVIGLLLLVIKNPFGLAPLIFTQWVMYPSILVLSILMVVDIPMFSMKSLKWKGNEMVYVFAILCVILLVTLKFAAISLIIILYILISIAQKLFKNELQSRDKRNAS